MPVKFATSMLTIEWVAVAEKSVLAVAKSCTRRKKNSTDMISMERELTLLLRRMDHDRPHRTEVDHEVDLVVDDLDLAVDPEVGIVDQNREVVIVEEAAAEVEVVEEDLEADLRSQSLQKLDS